MPIGVLTNCAAVLLGGLLGTYLGKILPRGLKDNPADSFRFLFHCKSVSIPLQSIWNDAVVLAISGRLYDWPSSAS